MSRENTKKYPRSVESKNSFFRIRAPENLDIALEGLIRKVLKEQPKMDDIYAFAADYFDMLLKIREKAEKKLNIWTSRLMMQMDCVHGFYCYGRGLVHKLHQGLHVSDRQVFVPSNILHSELIRGIRKLSAQDICPYHNEDDAHEMVKLASSFTKRTKPHSNTYKALTLRNQYQSKYRKSSEKLDTKDLEDKSKEDEGSDKFENRLSVVKENTEIEKAKDESVESESIENETSYSIKVSGQEIDEEVFIRANEVITEYNVEDEDSPRDLSGNGPETVGDINELRDKIRAVENEIKQLDNKENKSENDIADGEEGAGEGINETRNADENLQENKSGRSVEDVQEVGTGPAAETEVQENSVQTKPQEDQEEKHDTVEQSRDSDVNKENVDALDEKLDEQESVNKNIEKEESPKIDVEIDLKEVESATENVNREAIENSEETKLNAEATVEVTRSEAEEVKSAGDDAQKVGETNLEKQTENKGTEEENLAGMVGQDEGLQEKENEMMGEENLNSKNTKSEIPTEGEREATKVQDSEVDNVELANGEDVNSVTEDLGVFKGDTPASDKTPEERPRHEEEEKIEKQSVDNAGRDINVTHSATPVLTASALNGMEKMVEAPAEEFPTAEKILFLRDPETSIATEIGNFLDMEREHSSNEKEAMADGNSVESKIVSRTVSMLGTIKENEEMVIPGDDTSGKASEITQDPDDLVPDNQESSTTSDEIEFETSPAKYPDTDNDVTTIVESTRDDDMRKETRTEPEIILELNTDGQETEARVVEECKKEPKKVLLEVPELKLDENVARRSERETMRTMHIVEEPEDKAVPICGNVGNEIIQKGEVEKVELVEGEEDILQVHLTTTVETEHDPPDSVHVEMTSWIDPDLRVSVETKVESAVQDGGNPEKMQLIRAAVIIQNGFRRFKNKKVFEERKQDDKQRNNENVSKSDENESTAPIDTVADSHGDSNPPSGDEPERTLNLIRTSTLVESQSLDSVRKISPLKTRSLSSVRHGAGDFEVWNQLVKELEEAATKIQSNYRGYKSRKKLQRENAIQSTTTSEDSTSMPDPKIHHRHTGEFHDSLVLPLDPN